MYALVIEPVRLVESALQGFRFRKALMARVVSRSAKKKETPKEGAVNCRSHQRLFRCFAMS